LALVSPLILFIQYGPLLAHGMIPFVGTGGVLANFTMSLFHIIGVLIKSLLFLRGSSLFINRFFTLAIWLRFTWTASANSSTFQALLGLFRRTRRTLSAFGE
jgi:hypothetical protein